MIAVLTLAGWHVTGVIAVMTGLACLIFGTPDWQLGERLHWGDAGSIGYIAYGLLLTFAGVQMITAT